MSIQINIIKLRMVTIVAALFFFTKVSLCAQSDTAFVRAIIETQGENLKSFSKSKVISKINGAFTTLKKEKKLDKIFVCAQSIYFVDQKHLITCTEAFKLIQIQLQQLPTIKPELTGKYNHLLFVILQRCGKIHNSLPYAQLAGMNYCINGDSTVMSKLFNGLCVSYIKLRDFKQAVANGKQAVSFALDNDLERKSIAFENLGLAYLYSGNGFLGRVHLEKAKEKYYTTDLTNYYAWTAESYQMEGDNVCAMIYADSSINYAIKTKSSNILLFLLYQQH